MAIFTTVATILMLIGLCMLICGLIYKPLNAVRSYSNLKAQKFYKAHYLLERILSNKIIGKFLNYLAKDKSSRLNKSMLRIVELSEVGISLQQLYLFKILSFIIITFLLIVMSYTNTINQTRSIVTSSGQDKNIAFKDEFYDESKYQLYQDILESVGQEKLSKSSNTERYVLIEQKITEYSSSSDKQLIKQNTEWFLNSWTEVQKIKGFRFYYIVFILGSFFLPEIFLIIRWLIRGSVYKKEIVKLEYIFELLARVDGIKTIDIVKELSKSSKIFSKCMNEFASIFNFNKENAFDYLKSKNIAGLTKMANILEVYCLSDKELAIQILDREMMERDEQMIITAEESIDFIDLVAFLSIVPIVYELARLMLDPMLDIVYKGFEFI